MICVHDFTRKRQCYVANTFALSANHTISSCIGQREIELLFLAEIYGEKKGRGSDASRCWKARAILRNCRWRHTVTNTRNLSIRCVWGEEIVAQRLLERLETHDRFTTQFICMLITSWWSFHRMNLWHDFFGMSRPRATCPRVIYLSLRTFPLVAYRTLETPRDYHNRLC